MTLHITHCVAIGHTAARGSAFEMRDLARLMERGTAPNQGPMDGKVPVPKLRPDSREWDMIIDALRIAAGGAP